MKQFTYVDIVGCGDKCKGWLNLFFGEHCIALVRDVEIADNIRKKIWSKHFLDDMKEYQKGGK
jgi:hypothetical protein